LEEGLLQSMGRMPLLVRGPKPAAVLSRYGLKFTVKAPEPNTWRELLTAIDQAKMELNSQNVAVQEYGIPNPELCDGLTSRGATILPIPVYRWALPDDVEPLRQAIRQTIDGEVDALLFTSAQQVRHVLQIAEQMAQRDEWLTSANKTAVGSIGPTCSQTLREEGLTISVEASPPKMGPLVRVVMQHIADA
jgi:uroporphyrinogen-III synthase